MPTTRPTQPGITSTAVTTAMPRMDTTLHLPAQAVAWLAQRPLARALVNSVWNTLTELEQAGQHPGLIAALRRVLTRHQPTPSGRCRTCRRVTWRRRRFPCIVWHQIHGELLGFFAATGRHHQPAHTGGGVTQQSVMDLVVAEQQDTGPGTDFRPGHHPDRVS